MGLLLNNKDTQNTTAKFDTRLISMKIISYLNLTKSLLYILNKAFVLSICHFHPSKL